MKKEVIIAVLIGLSLGLIVTYGIYTARRTFMTNNSTKSLPSPTPPSTPSPNNSSLSVISPEDETLQFSKEVKVTGTTRSGSLIVIFVNEKNVVTRADQSGNFSIQTTLDEGSNVITTRAIDEDGKSVEDQRVVIFSTTSLDDPVASSSAKVSPSPSPKPKVTPKPTIKASPKVTPTP
jgi:hypothetical protein